jgi:hypothetical protein
MRNRVNEIVSGFLLRSSGELVPGPTITPLKQLGAGITITEQ